MIFLNPFATAALRTVVDALQVDPTRLKVGSPPKPEMGDYAIGCFPAAGNPVQAAQSVVEAFEPAELLVSAAAAGPFVNFTANREAVFAYVMRGDLIPAELGSGKTICIDYSSPNISKQLAYHHIRSMVIGQTLCNLYRALGYRVVGINHVGDWGTTHGLLLAAVEQWGVPDPITVAALNDLYVRAREAKTLDAKGREWFVRLENGDERARELWAQFRAVSLEDFEDIYQRLDIGFDEVRGESEYDVEPVLEMLEAKGLTEESDGALVVPLDEMPPLLLRKQDGATLYGTRDLAAAIYRHETYGFERNLYVVDHGQALHFRQLFTSLKKAGYRWADRCTHVPFGVVLMDGEKTGTRTGNVVLLRVVLDEAQTRSTDPRIGLGAVKFGNLVAQREKDVDFRWEAALAKEGDTAPYIQYAHARGYSIFARGDIAEDPTDVDASLLVQPLEWSVGLKLAELGSVIDRAAHANEPHVLCRYLLDLTTEFNRWYASGNREPELRVLAEDTALRDARLALVAAARDVFYVGLSLLGIGAPETM